MKEIYANERDIIKGDAKRENFDWQIKTDKKIFKKLDKTRKKVVYGEIDDSSSSSFTEEVGDSDETIMEIEISRNQNGEKESTNLDNFKNEFLTIQNDSLYKK